MGIPAAIIYMNGLIDEARRYAKRGLLTFAFGKYEEAKGVLGYIENQWREEKVVLSHEDEFALDVVRERLAVGFSALTNGGSPGLHGVKRASKDDFRDAVENAIKELSAMFQ